MSHSVFLHQGTTEGPAEWLLGRVCKFQAWLLSISEAVLFFFFFFCRCPRCPQHLSGGALKHNTPNEMWLVSPYCSIYTGRDERWGERCKKCSPAAWWGVVAFRPHGGGCVIFTLALEGGDLTVPERQRKIVDNYLVKSPGRRRLRHTASGCHTTDIWLRAWESAVTLLCWRLWWRHSPTGGMEQF